MANETKLAVPLLSTDAHDFVMLAGWQGMLHWLVGEPNALAQFTADTGVAQPARATGIAAMIDKATGFDPDDAFMRKFIPWATANYWGGDDEITPSIRAVLDGIASQERTAK